MQLLSIAKITSLIRKLKCKCLLRLYPCTLQQQEWQVLNVREVLAVVQVDPWVCAAVKTGEEHDSDKHWPCRIDMTVNKESQTYIASVQMWNLLCAPSGVYT